MQTNIIPMLLLVFSAALCWFIVWILRQSRLLEPAHYTKLCWTGALSFPLMFFTIIIASGSDAGLVAVLFIALACFCVLSINLVTQTKRMNSTNFSWIVVMGQGLFPFVLFAVADIERILANIT